MRLGLTLSQVARELGQTRRQSEKDLRRIDRVLPPRGLPRRWDPRAVDLLKALQGRPHRQLEPAHSDWLARYRKEH